MSRLFIAFAAAVVCLSLVSEAQAWPRRRVVQRQVIVQKQVVQQVRVQQVVAVPVVQAVVAQPVVLQHYAPAQIVAPVVAPQCVGGNCAAFFAR